MITVRNPVHAVLFLVLAFFTSAAIWLLLEAEFLAITLVLVYVGAVMVLFLFVVMMLDINVAKMRAGFARYLPAGLLVGATMAAEMIIILNTPAFDLPRPQLKPATTATPRSWASAVYRHVYPFEIAGVILLVAIVAAITLTLRKACSCQEPDSCEAGQREAEGPSAPGFHGFGVTIRT